jgi:hypothetical protein
MEKEYIINKYREKYFALKYRLNKNKIVPNIQDAEPILDKESYSKQKPSKFNVVTPLLENLRKKPIPHNDSLLETNINNTTSKKPLNKQNLINQFESKLKESSILLTLDGITIYPPFIEQFNLNSDFTQNVNSLSKEIIESLVIDFIKYVSDDVKKLFYVNGNGYELPEILNTDYFKHKLNHFTIDEQIMNVNNEINNNKTLIKYLTVECDMTDYSTILSSKNPVNATKCITEIGNVIQEYKYIKTDMSQIRINNMLNTMI